MYKKLDALLMDCRKGDKRAAECMLRELKPLVLSAVSSLNTDYDTREDMIQEGYLIVINSIRSYDPNKGVPFLGYLKKALYYGLYQSLKVRNTLSLNEVVGDDMEVIDLITDTSPSVEDAVIGIQIRERLHEAINNLTEKQRHVILERFFKGRKLKEIAINQGVSYMAAVMTQNKALKNLKKAMKYSID